MQRAVGGIDGFFGSWFGESHIGEWNTLNPDLMQTLYNSYKGSYALQALVQKLQQETMRGGLDVRRIEPSSYGSIVSGNSNGYGEQTPTPPQQQKQQYNQNITTKTKTKRKPQAARGGLESRATALLSSNIKKRTHGLLVNESNTLNISIGQQTRLRNALRQAILYGLLYGLVPVCIDGHHPESIRVPPMHSGKFVGRIDPKGNTEVGWQWNSVGASAQSVSPADDVWVFVWQNREPTLGCSAPFNSVILPLLPEIMRERELVEADTQAHYELSVPPFVLQENPRVNRDDAERQHIQLYFDDYLGDPIGDTPGHGPGGTLTGEQRTLRRTDLGGFIRSTQSRNRSERSIDSSSSIRLQLDPCTGEAIVIRRTVGWQRGAHMTPAGWLPTNSFSKPSLRPDLLSHRAHLIRILAAAIGIPASLAFSNGQDFTSGSGSVGRRARGNSGFTGGSALSGGNGSQGSGIYSILRDTVTEARTELSALFAQAHFHLIWPRELVSLSQEVAMGESLIQEDHEGTSAMARQLELLGGSLKSMWLGSREKQLRDTAALHRAAAVADQASKLWRGALMQQHIDAILQVVAGVRDGTVGFPGDMSLEGFHEREKRGEGLAPAPAELLRDPQDRTGDVTLPPKDSLRKEDSDGDSDSDSDSDGDRDRASWNQTRRPSPSSSMSSSIDPNQLAETMTERMERVGAEGRRVHGYTAMARGDESGRSGYQYRALTEEVPSWSEALAKAEQMVQTRLSQMQHVDQLRSRLTPTSGDRGETKVELFWLSPPVPDWGLLRELTLDGILNRHVFQEMVLAHMGFDTDGMTIVSKDTDPFGKQSPRIAVTAVKTQDRSSSIPKNKKKQMNPKEEEEEEEEEKKQQLKRPPGNQEGAENGKRTRGIKRKRKETTNKETKEPEAPVEKSAVTSSSSVPESPLSKRQKKKKKKKKQTKTRD